MLALVVTIHPTTLPPPLRPFRAPACTYTRTHTHIHAHRAHAEQVKFVNSMLVPRIARIRSELARRYGSKWASILNVTVSLGDGTPSRVAAISAGLRPFQPATLHAVFVKDYFYERRLFLGNIEYHGFRTTEAMAPLPVGELSPRRRALVTRMVQLRDRYMATYGCMWWGLGWSGGCCLAVEFIEFVLAINHHR